MRCCHVLPGRVLGGIRAARRLSLAVVLTLLLVAGALTTFLPSNKEEHVLELRRGVNSQGRPVRDAFTLIMQTYNRTDLLLRLLNHYQALPRLHRVIVVWNNVGEKAPEDVWNSLGPHPVPVVFKLQTTNRVRNRLQAFPELETEAVLMVDDDMLISAQDLAFAFSVWQQFPDQIVGFVPRKHIPTSSGVYSYGGFELQAPGLGDGDQYSMVLIGASFFSSKYLDLFQRQPAAVRTLIDETQNCDDIAMNFLVAKHIGKASGVFVKPVNMGSLEKETAGAHSGMWHRAEHFLQRSYCINKLVAIYEGMPLTYSNLMISQFGFPYANHKTILSDKVRIWGEKLQGRRPPGRGRSIGIIGSMGIIFLGVIIFIVYMINLGKMNKTHENETDRQASDVIPASTELDIVTATPESSVTACPDCTNNLLVKLAKNSP